MIGLATTLVISCNHEKSDNPPAEKAPAEDILEGKIEGLNISNLLTSDLEFVDNTEVVVSYVEVPKNFTIPKHYHPGEEFIYILEGSGVV